MPSKDLVKLSATLENDIMNMEPAVLERTNESVRKHLYWLAGQLTDSNVRSAEEIDALLHLYARVELLRSVVMTPEKFNLKELKELFKSTLKTSDADLPKTDFVKAIQDLNIPDADKQRLLSKALDTVRAQMAARLG